VLITGQAGIGKSEVALDLVARGHRLVADDMVHISRRTGGVLIGAVNETLRFHMEIRGLGIIDIHAMFGIRGIRPEKKIEVQVELVSWSANQQYERLGLADLTTEILSEKIPLVRLPIYPGKNISMIVETIALNQLLRNYGYNAAQEFDDYLNRQIGAKLTQKEEFHSHKFE
jgi:HPr kinase/phosphorylase